MVDPDGPDADLAVICEEDIRVALIHLPDLRVVTLNAANAEQVEIMCAGAVGVYMLSGRLRRLGSSLRFNLQLGNLQSNVVIWSEQLRLENADPAATVDHVVERAVGAVLPSINRDLPSRMAQRAGNDRDAALLYTEARLKVKVRGRSRPLGADARCLIGWWKSIPVISVRTCCLRGCTIPTFGR
ncbi:hypothetical protein QP185_22425 [Sphingomonas aerolata]|uniref:hypothetical protein n=1 Tax=Sphingomonas aerolata TaxID=185951 RepID=UPI002FE08ED5